MDIENDIFRKFTPDFNKIIEYGFKKNKAVYSYEKYFRNGEFRAGVELSEDGKISGKVFDMENDEEFLPLKVESRQGKFVGEVREEYISILTDIRDRCFSENYFISPQSNRIATAIIKKFGDKPIFMWEQDPTSGVYKNPDSGKWYGIVMYISRSKLKQNKTGKVEVMNLKLEPEKITKLVKKDGYYPAYHMNKKYWISLTLDDSIPDYDILKNVEESHSYTVKKGKSIKRL